MNENILLVDDEIQILNSLKRLFLFRGYNIFTANNGGEALSILQKEKINLMITDIRMPGISGYELLDKSSEVSPLTIRVVLSGYADESTLLKIQQNNLAKLYILKPWNNGELLSSVKQIFIIKEILEQKKLLKIIDEIKILPSPGNIYSKFEQLVKNNADMHEFAELIEGDTSIAAKILQVINSAFYGIRTGSVKMAITYLGLINVKNIILSLGIYNKQKNISRNKLLNDDIEILWKHSTLTNKILNYLYKRLLNKKIPDICDMAGLLHDIGKLVIINNFSDEYLKATKEMRKEGNIYNYFEDIEIINCSHEEIGAYFLYWWELPQQIVECALFHHKPLDERIVNKELVSLLYIADVFSWNIIKNTTNFVIEQDILNKFNLTTDDCLNLLNEIKYFI
ncbi:MAG: HDOD domain-containing protein [Sedimentibacter sp.]